MGKSFTYRKEFSIFIKCILKFYYVNFKAIGCILKLLPLQGALLTDLIPRALPWAKSFSPFRACGAKL